MPSMMDLLALPGETRLLTGFVKKVEVVAPDDKAKARAKEQGYEARTKNILTVQPNGLEDRNIRFDPEEFKPSELARLQGAFLVLECEVKPYTLDNGKSGETTHLVKLRTMYLDANGQAPPPK